MAFQGLAAESQRPGRLWFCFLFQYAGPHPWLLSIPGGLRVWSSGRGAGTGLLFHFHVAEKSFFLHQPLGREPHAAPGLCSDALTRSHVLCC